MVTAKLPTAQPALADFFGEYPNFPEQGLSGAHDAVVTTITLTANVPTSWPTVGAVTIDDEIIHYTGKSGATLTGCTRGAQSTAAASHADQARVGFYLTAQGLNQIIQELIQVTKTGAGAKGADVASADVLNIGEDGHYVDVTGTTGITSIEARLAGQIVVLQFDGILTITHGAALVLQGSANLTTAAGDIVAFISEGSGNWREVWRRLAAAAAVAGGGVTVEQKVSSTTTIINTGTESDLYRRTITGGTLGTTGALRLTVFGNYKNNEGNSRNLTLRLKYGATTMLTTPAMAQASGADRRQWFATFMLMAAGATNAQRVGVMAMLGAASAVNWNSLVGAALGPGYGTAAEDSTLDKDLVLTAQHSVAHLALEITLTGAILEKL